MRLRLEKPTPKPEPKPAPAESECVHEWDDVEPNPLAFRTVRVCVLCGVAAGQPEDPAGDES
jgi:hypothetical protein